jgi:hypothetical protein
MVYDYIPQFSKYMGVINQSVNELNNNTTYSIEQKGEINFKIPEIINSKSFIIEKNIVNAIKQTKPSKQLNMPFNFILLFPENLIIDDNKIYVIQIRQSYYNPKNDRREIPNPGIQEYCGKDGWIKGISGGYFIEDINGGMHLRYFSYPDEYSKHINIGNKLKTNYNYQKYIINFIFGFLNFLNNPEVSFTEHKQILEKNEKRVNRGKCPLPIKMSIVIDGKLKHYLNNYERESTRNPFSFRFWVRGHFRHLFSDKWKNKKGQTIWVLPYLKGQGILINKNYELVRGD